ncbi:bifunctional 2-C-methyl-D-erythritol 4-phosphate cytidylyltransferase/2-C-methyl-D-erythritol 2,4-cyclodiphosphate synthase [Acidisphaera sp. S103]|uniref:bifunctional 2-C-methyl-D-erythritol 4-phosphate cytidylyltransferase/2-C-methyl-D-erythritol 2,4-cyclodiphosphate synthase n=1 Tax=Acidisphaera sp. S103 TaxID=1747223 RepID=UPI00131E7ED8|nr:bifunctional 2-C-methyl-D-erythritol 4-phosphate cytidylyltransferase/2-C-methyl-D-erythritol 2,4-cyclodiphosphate synthase [Acidisphaera sp. S103]
MRIAAILVAAGSGTRFGAETPKQFLTIANKPVIRHAADALAAHVTLLQPVGDPTSIDPILHGITGCLPAAPGGATRQDSVRAGLEALAPHAPDVVLVHDAARPFIPDGTIPALLAALKESPGAIPAAPVADTLKRVVRGVITETVPRSGLFRAQTPQAFRFAILLAAHRAGLTGATDDASLLEAAGETVEVVPGSDDNIKLTYPDDLIRLERIMGALLTPRVGTGFDVHVLEAGRPLFLCGIQVPHDKGLAGHSDADVGIHALCDAIYGALAEGDIGRHFPPSEATWKDADSARFLTHAAERIAIRGGRLVNADVTLICERPKITPHAPAMIQRLASLLGVDPARISVKATTTERLGFTGRGEGIAAQAVVSILVPDCLPPSPETANP